MPLPECDYCGKTYKRRKSDQRFCSGACRKLYHRLSEVRGAVIYTKIMAWRAARHGTPEERREHSMTFWTRDLDRWAREDKQRKRTMSNA